MTDNCCLQNGHVSKQYEFILAICHHHANIVCGQKDTYIPVNFQFQTQAGKALTLYRSCAYIYKDDNLVKIRTLQLLTKTPTKPE